MRGRSDAPEDPASAFPPAAIVALEEGDRIQAIKLVREATGLGLKEAKEAVERLEAGEPPFPSQPPRRMDRGEFPLAAVSALQNGKLIDAIRIVREARGIGLKDAKAEVERYLESEPLIRSRFQSAHAESRRSMLLWAAAIALTLMLVTYFLAQP